MEEGRHEQQHGDVLDLLKLLCMPLDSLKLWPGGNERGSCGAAGSHEGAGPDGNQDGGPDRHEQAGAAGGRGEAGEAGWKP